MDKSTITYYDTHAAEYSDKTRYVNMHDIRSVFLNFIEPGARLMDIGCGGGRDMKIFDELGYTVDGIDASQAMCQVAEEYTEISVKCQDIIDWKPMYTYGGIWACASLLHLKDEEFFEFFKRAEKCLSSSGVIYFSMKSGIKDGYDEDGRWYLSFNNTKLERILSENPMFERVRYWKTSDSLKRDTVWENVILRKK